MNENKSNTLLLTVIGVATLLVAVVGASFAYFTAQLSGTETNTTLTVQAGTLTISYEGGSTLNPNGTNALDILPVTTGEPIITKKFTVTGTNTTTTKMPYAVQMNFTTNEFTEPGLLYSLEYTSPITNGSGLPENKITESLVTPTDPTELAAFQTALDALFTTNAVPYGTTSPFSLGTAYFEGPVTNYVHSYTLKIYFPDNGKKQDEHKGKEFKANIEVTVGEIYE